MSTREKETFLFTVARGLHMLVLVLDIDVDSMEKWMRMYASVVACTLMEQQGGFVGFCTAPPS